LGNALQRGTFEGQENPLSNIYASHLHEMTPYITLTGHKYEVTPIIASVWWWRSLPADVQNCAQKATRAAGIFQRTMLQNMEKKLQGIMISEGVVFKTADRAAYIAATRPIYTAYAKKFPMFIKQLLDAVAAETPAP
jgi:TRAP-type C4-dicarboxylate transport system substrate-binding protein